MPGNGSLRSRAQGVHRRHSSFGNTAVAKQIRFDDAVAGIQTLGSGLAGTTATMGVAAKEAYANTGLELLQIALPVLAIVQGICSMVRGVYSFLDTNHLYVIHGEWAPARNRARGIFDFISGGYLAEGGVEAITQSYLNTDISLVSSSLLAAGWLLLAAANGVVNIESSACFVGATVALAASFVPTRWFLFHNDQANKINGRASQDNSRKKSV